MIDSRKKIFDPTIRPASAEGLRTLGEAYLSAAEVLNENMDWKNAEGIYRRRRAFIIKQPFYYLLSHSFELLTKAYLKSRGVSDNDLFKLSHNISKLINEAVKHGFIFEDEWLGVATVLENLNGRNKMRYPRLGMFLVGPSYYFDPENLVGYLHNYHDKIKRLVGGNVTKEGG
jgi:hypothetical protein